MNRIQTISFWSVMAISLSFQLWFLVTQPTTVEYSKEWQSNIDPEDLKKHVKMLSQQLPKQSEDLDKLDRSAQSSYKQFGNFTSNIKRSDDVDTLGRSAEYIYQELSKFTSEIRYQSFPVRDNNYRNVIATFGPKYTNRLYVVGAHYDSYYDLHGADDNASGVAGLIELGRLFSQTPPTTTIQLVAYALEEPPYFGTSDMGSYHHAKRLRNKSTNVTLMISLEMIGYYTDEPNSQNFPISFLQYMYSDIGNFIAVVGGIGEMMETRFFKKHMIQATPLPVYSINALPQLAGINFSDHLNFWSFDYPAIMITDTAFYRNDNYHTQDDTWEKLDYDKMSMVIQGVHHSLISHMSDD